MKARKKPVVVEVIRWDGLKDHHKFPQWLKEAFDSGVCFMDNSMLYIKTLEGNHMANYGDWIIQGVKGELYPCKPDVFDLTYEFVEEAKGSE